MPLTITFFAAGRSLEATVTYTPEVPARTYGRPEDCDPGEAAELEFVTLVDGDDGTDCSHLLRDRALHRQLAAEAMAPAHEAWQAMQEEAREYSYESSRDYY